MELLEQSLALIERAPLLIICVFRPVRDHACWRFRELAAQTYAERHTELMLDPLTPSESQTLVANLLQVEGLPVVLRESILTRAEGNPFYVEEVIRSIIDGGAIIQDQASGRWIATREVAEIPIPDTLQGVLMARIDRLQEDTRRVLQMASVIGRVFLYRVLAEIAEEERWLDDRLLTLRNEDMIRERARITELEYIFKHELTREAAYNGLLRKERRIFHRQVAEALERLFPERVEEHMGLLAYHWERAGDAEKATEYLGRAGDQARMLYAHQEAIDYYERALALLREQGDHERAARTWMKVGLTYQSTFDFAGARQAYEEGFALWQRTGQMEPALVPAPALQPFRMGWPEPPTLDPALCGGTLSQCVIDQLFSGLVEGTPEMEVVPDVARSWEVQDDGCKYVFHLRDDVRWSNGARMTADDFEYAWKRVLDPATEAPAAGLLYDLKGGEAFHRGQLPDADRVAVRALDAVTLVVELEGPTGYFLHLLTHPVAYAVPQHIVEAHGDAWTQVQNLVTNGPFRLQAWQQGKSMVLTRNPEYHGRFGGNVQRVELDLVSPWSDGGRLKEYEIGAADIGAAYDLPPMERDRAHQKYGGEYVTGPFLMVNYADFDVGRPPFDDSRVRRAFVLATDREALVDVFRRGYQDAATGGFVPPGLPGHSKDIGLPYDPERARELLAEAGYPGGGGFPGAEMRGGRLTDEEIEHLGAQWRENLGVEVRWCDESEGGLPHLRVRAWVPDYPDPDSFVRDCKLPRGTGWQSEAYERLVEKARRSMDQKERIRLYKQADRMLIEEAVVMPLFYGRFHALVKPWVKSFPLSPIKYWFWKDVIIEPH
jgi:oligopeptide transport system substrate-binding protein